MHLRADATNDKHRISGVFRTPRPEAVQTSEVAAHPADQTDHARIAAAASLYQTTDPRAGKRVSAVLQALARGDIGRATRRLQILDSAAGVHRFRRRLASAHLPDDVVLATATILARDADKDLDRQGRVELLLRRLLVVSADSGEQVMSREAAAPVLDAACEGAHASPEVRASALASFHEANTKLHSCESVDDVFSKWVIADVLGFKATLRGAFRDPDVLYASIAFSVEVENRLAMLASLEDNAAGDVGHRLWKLELELRTMFRKLGEGETYRVGAFEKVDWRRFKWRRGLGRLRDAKIKTSPSRWPRRSLVGATALASVLLLFQWIPTAGTLRKGDLDVSRISTLLTSSVTNGDAFAFRADADVWQTMSNEQRGEEAKNILDRLVVAGIRDAVVQVHGALAIRIESGVVVFVAQYAKEEKR